MKYKYWISKVWFLYYQRLIYPVYRLLYKRAFDKVPVFCLFLGYPRSGHSLIGSLINAHPDAWIAHELNVLKFLKRGYSRNAIFSKLIAQGKWFNAINNHWSGYSYKVAHQWQNQLRTLNVIGDKRGGATTRRIRHNPGLLPRLYEVIDKKIKIIHVYRNPFDNIATRARGGNHKNKPVSEDILYEEIRRHFRDIDTIEEIRQSGKYDLFEVSHEEFSAHPYERLQSLCDFLGLEVFDSYLRNCAAIVHSKPSKSRNKIHWPDHAINMVEEKMKDYDFLRHYSFYE